MLTDRELGALAPKKKRYARQPTVTVCTRRYRLPYRHAGVPPRLPSERRGARHWRSGAMIRPARGRGIPRHSSSAWACPLREARTLLDRARRAVERGVSPSRAKVEKRIASNEAIDVRAAGRKATSTSRPTPRVATSNWPKARWRSAGRHTGEQSVSVGATEAGGGDAATADEAM